MHVGIISPAAVYVAILPVIFPVLYASGEYNLFSTLHFSHGILVETNRYDYGKRMSLYNCSIVAY